MQTVTLASGQQLIVPKLVHEMCSYVLTKVCTEGLFRKGGSKSRQNEIKVSVCVCLKVQLFLFIYLFNKYGFSYRWMRVVVWEKSTTR